MEGPSKNKASTMNEGDPLEGRYLPTDGPAAVFRCQMALQEAQMRCLPQFGELVKCRECGSNNDLHGKDKSLYDENSELTLHCDNSACELTDTMPSLGRGWRSSLEREYEDLDGKEKVLWDMLTHIDVLCTELNIALEAMAAVEETRQGPSPSSLALSVSSNLTNNAQAGFTNSYRTEKWGDMEVENASTNSKKRDRPASTPDPSPVVRKVATFRDSPSTKGAKSPSPASVPQSPMTSFRNPFKKQEAPAKPPTTNPAPPKPLLLKAQTSASSPVPTSMGPPAAPPTTKTAQSEVAPHTTTQSEVAALRAENLLLKQEMATLREQLTMLQRTMNKLIAQGQQDAGSTSRGRGGYRGGRGGVRRVTRYSKSGRKEEFTIGEDSDSDDSRHYTDYEEDTPEDWKLQRGPNYPAKLKAKEEARKAGMDINSERAAPEATPTEAAPPTYAEKARAPATRGGNGKKQRERELAFSFFRPIVPQEWKLAKILWNPSKSVKRAEDRSLMSKLAWRAMEKLGIRSQIREISLVGKSMLILYYCEAVATQVEEALAKANITIINSSIPTTPALGAEVNIKDKTINRISYLCSKHSGLTKLVELFMAELPTEWREDCQLKTMERLEAAPTSTGPKDRNRAKTTATQHESRL